MTTTGRGPIVQTDLAHGGRWSSLILGGRQWLWRRDDPQRAVVRPGDAFVDVGGIEECVPTVRGTPDHGAAWSRPWQRDGAWDAVDCGSFVLHRRITAGREHVTSEYRLRAEPGFRFLWAAHALLDLAPTSRVSLPPGAPVRLYPEAAPLLEGGWPPGARSVLGAWPEPFGIPLDRLGPDDGTAIGASVVGCAAVRVHDGAHALTMELHLPAGLPRSIALWRNLRGFPAGAPYRSIGVEPMLGTVFDLSDAGPEDAVTVPASGEVAWVLEMRVS